MMNIAKPCNMKEAKFFRNAYSEAGWLNNDVVDGRIDPMSYEDVVNDVYEAAVNDSPDNCKFIGKDRMIELVKLAIEDQWWAGFAE